MSQLGPMRSPPALSAARQSLAASLARCHDAGKAVEVERQRLGRLDSCADLAEKAARAVQAQ